MVEMAASAGGRDVCCNESRVCRYARAQGVALTTALLVQHSWQSNRSSSMTKETNSR
jgi:hypothetical protein